MDGFELMQKLRGYPQFKEIIIVSLTAYAMTRDKEKILAAGFDGYMTKPID